MRNATVTLKHFFLLCHQIRSGAIHLSYPTGKCPVLPLEAEATKARLELAVCSPVIEDINGWGDRLCSACPIAAGLEPLSVEVSILKRCHKNCATETKPLIQK